MSKLNWLEKFIIAVYDIITMQIIAVVAVIMVLLLYVIQIQIILKENCAKYIFTLLLFSKLHTFESPPNNHNSLTSHILPTHIVPDNGW